MSPRPGFVLEVDKSTPPILFHHGEGFRLERLPAGRSRVIYAAEPLKALKDPDGAIRDALENAPGMKLNPLQQLTYLALLNVLFPLQIGTGVLIWAVGHWPSLGEAVGGLSVLAPLHNVGSWLFMAFFVLHVYLVTTGRTVGDHLQSMITGYRDAEPEPGPAAASSSTGAAEA